MSRLISSLVTSTRGKERRAEEDSASIEPAMAGIFGSRCRPMERLLDVRVYAIGFRCLRPLFARSTQGLLLVQKAAPFRWHGLVKLAGSCSVQRILPERICA